MMMIMMIMMMTMISLFKTTGHLGGKIFNKGRRNDNVYVYDIRIRHNNNHHYDHLGELPVEGMQGRLQQLSKVRILMVANVIYVFVSVVVFVFVFLYHKCKVRIFMVTKVIFIIVIVFWLVRSVSLCMVRWES